MHSWVFRNRRRLEAIYGMRVPERGSAPRPAADTADARSAAPPRLRVHALMPCRRRRDRRAAG
ncbi:MAG TPA: hypothetical protein ENJ09_00950 [Planctomycetes bacterium]|nr:hypothetical protein [Planctomycetota bacterium]